MNNVLEVLISPILLTVQVNSCSSSTNSFLGMLPSEPMPCFSVGYGLVCLLQMPSYLFVLSIPYFPHLLFGLESNTQENVGGLLT